MKKTAIVVMSAMAFAASAFAGTAPAAPANASNTDHPCSNLVAKDVRIDAKFGETSKQDTQNDKNLAKHGCVVSPSA
jgi:hypothetical protein